MSLLFAQAQQTPELYYHIGDLKPCSLPASAEFVKSENQQIDLGYFDHKAWIKFEIETGDTDQYIIDLQRFFMDSAQVFIYKADTLIYQSGYFGMSFLRNGLTENYADNGYAIPLSLTEGNSYQCFLSIYSRYSPLRARIEVFTEEEYNLRERPFTQKIEFWYIVSGFVMLIASIALILFLFTKQWKYLAYVLYTVFHTLNIATARGFVLPFVRYIDFYIYDIRGFLNICVLLVSCWFCLSIIPVKFTFRWMRLTLIGLMSGTVVILFVGILVPLSSINYHITLVVFKSILFTSFFVTFGHLLISALKGYKMGWYFVSAYSMLFISSIVHILNTIQVVPYSYSGYIWETGMFFEIIIFTVGFLYEYHLTIKERLGLMTTLSEQKSLYIENQFRALESERRRIAENLHDGLVQQLVSVKFKVDQVSQPHKDELLGALEDVTHEARNLSHQIMPKSLTKLGLSAALEDLIQNTLLAAKISCNYEFHNSKDHLPDHINLVLYRSAQELVQNVLKHSRASLVDIQIYQVQNSIHLLVEDDGIGFLTTNETHGIGLESIKERISVLKGTVLIQSKPDDGAMIHIKLPLS